MRCPSCGNQASNWVRSSFSLQGVTVVQSLEGKLKCQHCGTLLRNVRYGKQIWIGLAVLVAFMALMWLFSSPLYKAIGTTAVAIYWVVLVGLVCFIFAYGAWKYAVLEVVKEDAAKE